MSKRKVARIVQGNHAIDGAGVSLTRVIGNYDVYDFDPFLMLDAFDSTNPDDYTAGFPWHPHRGIETVSYLIRGRMDHGDSIGNTGSITAGGAQWMTAGSGIMHQEMPKPTDHLLGVQLWINLPQKDKMASPAYNDITPDEVAKVNEDGVHVGVISGEYKGTKAHMQGNYVKVTYLDVELAAERNWNVPTPEDHTVFIYIVSGSLEIDGETYKSKRAVLFEHGNEVALKAGKKGTRFLYLQAKPLREPVAWGGPIVMNTRNELHEAFAELENGTFIKG